MAGSLSARLVKALALGCCLMLIGAGFAGKTVSPPTYAKSVCGALSGWAETIATRQATFDNAIATAPSDAAKRAKVVSYLNSVTDTAAKLAEQITKAGRPDAQGGEAVAQIYRKGLIDARDRLADGYEEAVALNASGAPNSDFEALLADLGDNVPADIARTLTDASAEFSNELDRAFRESEACQGLDPVKFPITGSTTGAEASTTTTTLPQSPPPTVAGALDEGTFETCRSVRAAPAAPNATNANRLSDQFEDLRGKRPKEISEAFADADSKADRRKALKAAAKWCRSEDSYRKADLTVPPSFEVADSSTATIVGTATPGATVTAGGASVTAGPDGVYSIDVPGLVGGENRTQVQSDAELHYPTTKTVTITQVESELAFKSSCAEIPYDELVKDPDALIGRRIYSRAQVFQFDSRTAGGLLVSVTLEQPGRFEFWSDNVFLVLEDAALGNGIDNGDIIEFWGTVSGTFDYSTAIGGSNSVPSVVAKYMTLTEKRDE